MSPLALPCPACLSQPAAACCAPCCTAACRVTPTAIASSRRGILLPHLRYTLLYGRLPFDPDSDGQFMKRVFAAAYTIPDDVPVGCAWGGDGRWQRWRGSSSRA